MEIFFVNNLNIPYNDRRRKGELYDKFIDENFLPADIICIAGGISEYVDMEISFLTRLSQKYSHVFYVYGGCDLLTDMPLDLKFERIKNNFRRLQKNKCTPERLDGNIFNVNELVLGGFMCFDNREDISRWNWWTDSKKDYMEFETERFNKIINNTTPIDIMVSYYKPINDMFEHVSKVWHYGCGDKKEIKEKNGKLLLTNSCNATSTKYTKHDFLIKI